MSKTNDQALETQETPAPADATVGTMLARLTPEQKQRLTDLASGDLAERERILARALARFSTEIASNRDMASCEPRSVVMALAACVALDLQPQFGMISSRNADVIILPRADRQTGVKSAHAQMTASGLMKLAARDGYRVTAQPLYAQDRYDIDLGRCHILHEPSLEGGDLVGAWALFHRNGEAVHLEVLRRVDMERIRDSSDAWRRQGANSPWGKWPDRMAVKSCIARGVRHLYAPTANKGASMEDGQ